jgi:hypothetical protein
MLSGSLGFSELLAVPVGHFPVEIAHDVAVDQYSNDVRSWGSRATSAGTCRSNWTPWPGSGDCFAQRVLEAARADDGGNFCVPAAAVHGPMVVVGLIGHPRVFEFSRREPDDTRIRHTDVLMRLFAWGIGLPRTVHWGLVVLGLQNGSYQAKVGQVQIDAVLAVAGNDDPAFTLRVPPRALDDCEGSMQLYSIITRQMADRRALDVDTNGGLVIRIVVLRYKPRSDWQAVFPAARVASSRHSLSSADALKDRLVEVLAYDPLPAIVWQPNHGLLLTDRHLPVISRIGTLLRPT